MAIEIHSHWPFIPFSIAVTWNQKLRFDLMIFHFLFHTQSDLCCVNENRGGVCACVRLARFPFLFAVRCGYSWKEMEMSEACYYLLYWQLLENSIDKSYPRRRHESADR